MFKPGKAKEKEIKKVAVPFIYIGELKQKNKITDKKLSELNEATSEATEVLKKMELAMNLATTLLAAQNDSWDAFDQLLKWSEDKAFPLWEVAANAYVKIRVFYGAPVEPGYLNINWSSGVDPSKLPLRDFTKAYTTLNPIYHTHLVHTVCGRSDIPKNERTVFLIEVLKTSNSLTARHYAAKFFVVAVGDKNLKW